MPYSIYIIRFSDAKYYIGMTKDLVKRIKDHRCHGVIYRWWAFMNRSVDVWLEKHNSDDYPLPWSEIKKHYNVTEIAKCETKEEALKLESLMHDIINGSCLSV